MKPSWHILPIAMIYFLIVTNTVLMPGYIVLELHARYVQQQQFIAECAAIRPLGDCLWIASL